MWAMFAHLAAFAGFFPAGIGFVVGPLVVWLIKKEQYPFVDEQGKEAVNFQITMLIYWRRSCSCSCASGSSCCRRGHRGYRVHDHRHDQGQRRRALSLPEWPDLPLHQVTGGSRGGVLAQCRERGTDMRSRVLSQDAACRGRRCLRGDDRSHTFFEYLNVGRGRPGRRDRILLVLNGDVPEMSSEYFQAHLLQLLRGHLHAGVERHLSRRRPQGCAGVLNPDRAIRGGQIGRQAAGVSS